MNSVVSINSLDLSEEMKTLLKDNEIYTIDDFIEHSINVFKKCFLLTFDDWHSIIKAFITLHAVKKVQDRVVGAALKKPTKKEVPSNALIVNLFDEKFVVSTIKKGKWLHEDYIIKSLARGVVFSSREDAQRFAELICVNNRSRVIVHNIKNAQDTINVIVALTADRKNAVILFKKSKLEESILQALTDENNFFSAPRAYKLALAAVERINQIYDYEIAVPLAFVCGEKGLVALEITPEEDATDDSFLNAYVNKSKYAKALEQLIDKKGDDYFTWGRNAAISDSQQRSIRCIETRIYKCFQRLSEFEEAAGITEEDVAYENGYIEGLKIALKIQKECVSDSLIGKVALIDCWEVASKLGIDTQKIIGCVKDSNCKIFIDYFDNFDMLNEKVAEYDAVYLIVGGRMSHSDEDTFFNLQMQFYEMHKKQLYYICVSKDYKKQFFRDLFLLNDLDDEEEQ